MIARAVTNKVVQKSLQALRAFLYVRILCFNDSCTRLDETKAFVPAIQSTQRTSL
jgi:hypothetical protein